MTPVLLYDGECGFCARSVQFVLRHEQTGRATTLRFAPLQGVFGAEIRARQSALLPKDSILWVEPARDGDDGARVLSRSDAALAVARHMGGRWRVLANCAALVPSRIRDAAYDFVARHRGALAPSACLLPTDAQRSRFLP